MKSFYLTITLLLTFFTVQCQSFSSGQLFGTWEGKQAVFSFNKNNTYRISRSELATVGHWKIEENSTRDLTTEIVLSYAGYELDSRFQIIKLEDEQLQLKDLSDGAHYSFKKKKQPVYTISKQERSLLFWGTLGALILLSNDSGSSKSSSYKGTYSNDPNVDRYFKNAAEQRTYDLYHK